MKFELQPIGIIHSPYKEKFGTPRQAGLIKDAAFSLEVLPPFDCDEAFEGLQDFSHLWLTFIFHKNKDKPWSPRVRPPRLGGNQSIGVFASRSPYRPNPIGLSSVSLTGIRRDKGKLFIDIKGADLIDGTPVLDIKPYLPYSDCIAEAKAGYAKSRPSAILTVSFNEQLTDKLDDIESAYLGFKNLIIQIISLDPRPAYVTDKQDDKLYGMKLMDFNVQWQVNDTSATVVSVSHI